MKIKLTREDYEGYLSQMLLKQKQYQMAIDEAKMVEQWLKAKLKKYPQKKKS